MRWWKGILLLTLVAGSQVRPLVGQRSDHQPLGPPESANREVMRVEDKVSKLVGKIRYLQELQEHIGAAPRRRLQSQGVDVAVGAEDVATLVGFILKTLTHLVLQTLQSPLAIGTETVQTLQNLPTRLQPLLPAILVQATTTLDPADILRTLEKTIDQITASIDAVINEGVGLFTTTTTPPTVIQMKESVHVQSQGGVITTQHLMEAHVTKGDKETVLSTAPQQEVVNAAPIINTEMHTSTGPQILGSPGLVSAAGGMSAGIVGGPTTQVQSTIINPTVDSNSEQTATMTV